MKPRQLSYHMIVFCKTKFGVIVIFCLLSCRKERALILLIIFILQANPKTRGYLWFCTECDESVSDWELWITQGGIFRTITVGGGGGGREGTPLYLPFWYVLPQWVGFLPRFGLKTVIDFAYFGLNSGMVFVGTHERICRFNSKWIRKKE